MTRSDRDSTLPFLHDLIHELKDPFTAIYGSLQLLPLLESLPEDEREYLINSLQRNAQALKQVLEDASLFTKMAFGSTQGSLPSGSGSCDLAAALGGALEDLSPRLVSREQTVVPPRFQGAVLVRGDADLLRGCLACLLGSLSRGSLHGEPLNCEVRAESERIFLELTTSGQILAEDYRVELAGLLANALGAELRVLESGWLLGLSKPVGWEAHKPDSQVDQTTPSETQAEEGAGLRILVVEDNPLARAALAAMLRRAGSNVRDVGNAEDAFEVMDDEPPDLILCDLGLPGASDGLDLARRARRDPRTAHTRLIAVTGHAASKEQQARQAGFDLVVEKPLDDDSLRRLLRQTKSRGGPTRP